MAVLPLPTDSIQRRHFAQLAATLDLPAPPEDSVLRRHYTQLFAARAERRMAKGSATATVRVAAAAPRAASAPRPAIASVSPIRSAPQPANAASAATPAAQAAPQGFIARLFAKLFG